MPAVGSSNFSQGDHASRNPEVAIGSYPLFDPQHGPNTDVVLRVREAEARGEYNQVAEARSPLSRRKQGFESPRARQSNQLLVPNRPARSISFSNFSPNAGPACCAFSCLRFPMRSKTDFDLAILDADLKGRSVSPIADALVARDIRFVFVTGYGEQDCPPIATGQP